VSPIFDKDALSRLMMDAFSNFMTPSKDVKFLVFAFFASGGSYPLVIFSYVTLGFYLGIRENLETRERKANDRDSRIGSSEMSQQGLPLFHSQNVPKMDGITS
jgi:hypothetical protein